MSNNKTEDDLSTKERTEVQKEIKKALAKQIIEKAKYPITVFHGEFKQQVSTAIIAAFGLIIALAWRDVINNIIGYIPTKGILETYPYLALIISATILTFLSVIGILLISQWAKKPEIVQK